MKDFTIIVAVDSQRGIGKDDNIPWRLKSDMKWFRETTTGAGPGRPNAVIMGRRTWESIPERFRPLKDRFNIVLSSKSDPVWPCHAENLDEALQIAEKKAGEIYIIGGGRVYSEAFKHPAFNKLIITELDRNFDCDIFFPDYSGLVPIETALKGIEDGISYEIKIYRKG